MKICTESSKVFKSSGELLKCFDDKGNVIKSKTREVVHKKPNKIWHAVTAVWLLNDKGDILCTERSEKNEGNPGKWQTYLGGHIKANHSFIESAQSEVAEEIGLTLPRRSFLDMGVIKREDARHIQSMFTVLFNKNLSSLVFYDGEIKKARWVSFNKYQKQKNINPDSWCNNITLEQYKKALKILNINL